MNTAPILSIWNTLDESGWSRYASPDDFIRVALETLGYSEWAVTQTIERIGDEYAARGELGVSVEDQAQFILDSVWVDF